MFKPLATAEAIIMALTAPAWAQFPPPGIYQCVDMDGKPFGTLNLQAAGDYDFRTSVTIGGVGQLASSGNSVNATSGPLYDIGLMGSFATAEGRTSFMFTTTLGSVLCGVAR